MPIDSVEVATRAIAAFNAREVEVFAALTAPDFEWLPSMSPVEGESFNGPEGVSRYFEYLEGAWQRFRIHPDEFRVHRAGVLVLGRLEGCGRSSGAIVEALLGMAFEIRDGLITRIRGYLDHSEALRATGLE
jgi:ketosteroid isomerase-like protein